MTRKTAETWYPWLFGAMGTVIAAIWWVDDIRETRALALLGATTTFMSIICGFLVTSLAVLASGMRSRAIRWLQEAGHYTRLTRFIRDSIMSSLLLVLLCLIGLLVDHENGGCVYRICRAVWVGLLISTVLAFWRVMRLLITVMLDQDK